MRWVAPVGERPLWWGGCSGLAWSEPRSSAGMLTVSSRSPTRRTRNEQPPNRQVPAARASSESKALTPDDG